VDGAMNTKGGEMETDAAPVGPVMMTMAAPLRVGSAALVAVTVTGSDVGTVAGARKSMLAEAAPVGAMHGTLACWQIWPRIVFPLATPLTDQVTAVFEVFVTVGISVTR
jgi:hypothetical protein